MIRTRKPPEPTVLDTEAWDAPFQLSVDDLYRQAGADRRAALHGADDREDDR
uniref:Uncharacterized protein n=1 Tax=Brevundimonas basaltis TaxID=472166 RepID=A0A7W8I0P9_9CAUL|nr:hypothetical protein [Brevundimonas basaltis]